MTTTDTKQQHTAGRLTVFTYRNGSEVFPSLVAEGQHLIDIGIKTEADADRLALCWNMHDELVEALVEIGHLTLGNSHEMEMDIRAIVLTAITNAGAATQQPTPNTENSNGYSHE